MNSIWWEMLLTRGNCFGKSFEAFSLNPSISSPYFIVMPSLHISKLIVSRKIKKTALCLCFFFQKFLCTTHHHSPTIVIVDVLSSFTFFFLPKSQPMFLLILLKHKCILHSIMNNFSIKLPRSLYQ